MTRHNRRAAAVILANPAAYADLIIRDPSDDQVNQFIALGQLGRGFFELLAVAMAVGALVLALETFVNRRSRAYLVANLTLVDARTIGVQPFEKKMLAAIEKAIRDADLGLNPSSQGEMIRVPTPPLTEERRKEMVKLTKSEGEDAKIAVRNIRRDANEAMKKMVKDKTASEDDERRSSDEIQKLTDKAVADIDKLLGEKEKEILTV